MISEQKYVESNKTTDGGVELAKMPNTRPFFLEHLRSAQLDPASWEQKLD